MRLRRAGGARSGAAGLDEDQDEEDEDEDSSDAELLELLAKKLDTRPPPPTPPKASARQNLDRDEESDELSDEEIFPSPGTRAQAEKSRRTQGAAKVAPYVPPPGTRAASMMEKGKGKARETALRRK